MNPSHSPEPHPSRAGSQSNEINLIDWLVALAKRKRLVFGLPALFAACAALVSLAIPNIYQATTKILPSQQNQSNATAALNCLVGLAGSTPGALNVKIPIELYVSMLRSGTVADNLIARFDLKQVYGTESLEIARQVLGRNSIITAGKDGLIVITAQDKDPKRVAQIANAYTEELLKLTKRLALTEASHRRLFYEDRLQDTKARLAEVEVEQKRALGTREGIPIDRRHRAVVETAARLRAQIAAKEIELGAMQAFITINNQQYIRGHQDIGAMRANLVRLENPRLQDHGKQPEMQASFGNARIFHDLKYYNMLHELLQEQYEAARIDEANDATSIQVLDKAVEPDRSSEPKRARVVTLSAIVGLFIAIFWVLLFDVIQIRESLTSKEQLDSGKLD